MLDSHATVEPVEEDRPLVDGDWAEIQFRGEVKDLAQTVTEEGVTNTAPTQEPITGEDVLIEIGGKNTLAAFNDALRGAKAGSGAEVRGGLSVGLRRAAACGPDGELRRDREEHQAQDAIRSAMRSLPSSLATMRAGMTSRRKLREHAADRKKNALENGAKDKMLDELIGRYHFPVPESFVQQQIEARLDRGLARAGTAGHVG